MCGISGFIVMAGNLLSGKTVLNMANLIHHRGPDDEGFIFLNQDHKIITAGGRSTPYEVWKTATEYRPIIEVNDNSDIFSILAFGHKRLSILDLTPAGHQPMSYNKGRYWIIYNGEIFNYVEINNELEKLGHQFTTKTDTETILAAYSEWGEACLNRFVGMWAFAIYDRYRNEIFLARDRYGIKPLYYYISPDGNFYFASEIKQFTALEHWQSKINPARVYDQLIYSLTDHTDETMFAGVFQLPNGAFFRSSLDSIKPNHLGRIQSTKWYWLKRNPFKGSFIEAASVFRTLFERAVKEHLHADVPVGTALSGGLDSSSIVCEVNRILKSSNEEELQKTFSSCAVDERYSEKRWMDIVINQTKVNASFTYPDVKDLFNLIQDLIWYHDEPYQSQSAFLAYNVFKLAKDAGVKVLLNGQGADEYLGGYGQFTVPRYASMVRHLKISSLLGDIKNYSKLSNINNINLFLLIVSHFTPSKIRRSFAAIKSSSDNIKNIIDVGKLNIKATHPYDNIPVNYNTVPEVSEHLTFYSTLPKYLRWEDRNSMANSVEARVPFLDHRLVEFTYNLPDDFLERDGITKKVMREAMKGLLPEQIKDRKDKMGFTTPEEIWVKKEATSLFRNKISEAIYLSNGIIKPGALKYFDKVADGALPFDYTYWRIIMLGEWIQRFYIKI